jgi:RNA polymerase sigma factor (sigma-70 family)
MWVFVALLWVVPWTASASDTNAREFIRKAIEGAESKQVSNDAAMDIAQEAFLRKWKADAAWFTNATVDDVRAYAYTSGVNGATDALRRSAGAARQVEHLDELGVKAAKDAQSDQQTAGSLEDGRRIIADAQAAVGSEASLAARLAHVEGMSRGRIAATMGLTEHRVRAALGAFEEAAVVAREARAARAVKVAASGLLALGGAAAIAAATKK